MIQFRQSGICVFQSALYQTTATVIDTPDLVLVVDPNWLPHEVAEIVSYVNIIKGERPVYLLFTHSDYDHIIGWQAFPEAITIASEAFVQNPAKDKEVEQILTFDDKYYIQRSYPIRYPEIQIVIRKDEEFLSFGQTRLRFWLAPGHNADGLFALLEPLGVWMAGDYLSDVEFPFVYHSVEDYQSTLDKASKILSQSRPKVLVPGHGQVCQGLPEMGKRIIFSQQYLKAAIRHARGEVEFDEAALLAQYDFPKGLRGSHQDNLNLISKSISKS